MNALRIAVWNLLVKEDGPTAVEYAVMLGLIILVCFVAISNVGTQTNTLMSQVVDKGGFGN